MAIIVFLFVLASGEWQACREGGDHHRDSRFEWAATTRPERRVRRRIRRLSVTKDDLISFAIGGEQIYNIALNRLR
ncbi:MAG: hypothetical protein JNK99_01800 [Candidatus Accumulibacter sp.]|uniref:hypothetical protein n=1 Tax=Accumulibacter sp. TaxID=2053492 RepID=UPI001A5DFA4B|nr:hypothetical protein [Accumulibacter sp.]MBL8393469.1 hypothetical protein [Accumulibacter sp.]